jgi:ATP-dependent Lon protease
MVKSQIQQSNTKSHNKKSKSTLRDKKRDALQKSVKENCSSSDSESDYYYYDYDSDTSHSSEQEMNTHEYRKFLSTIFPSKHINKNIDKYEKITNDIIKKDTNKETIKDNAKTKSKKRITPTLISKPKSKNVNKKTEEKEKIEKTEKIKEETKEETNMNLPSEESSYDFNDSDSDYCNTSINESSQSSESNTETASSEYDSDDSMDSDDLQDMLKDKMNFNIIFTIGGKNVDDEYSDDEDYSSDESTTITSESESESEIITRSKNKKEKNDDESESGSECENKKTNQKQKQVENKKLKQSNTSKPKTQLDNEKLNDIFNKMYDVICNVEEKDNKDKTEQNDIYKEAKIQFEMFVDQEKQKQKKINKKQMKKEQKKNTKDLKKIFREKNNMNDIQYFSKLEPTKQKELIQEVELIMKHTQVHKPYKITLIESNIPTQYKANALRKINTLKYMDTGSGEYYKIKQWVDTFMRIPFGLYNSLPVQMSDGIDKCHTFMKDAKETLDNAVYGLNDAKMQIMQMVGQWISNPQAIGTAIAIKGPMGTGKTTLVKEGISKILNRPFAFVPLGGATDSSFLEGHSYTYEGSIWGKIVDILIQNKSMNPVIYFDELDKVSDTPKGEEIIGILTHLTDTTQNSQFHDKYFSEIDFDLSKALFIFSYNDESKVNTILKDRMYRIQTNGYNASDKITISQNYLIPSISQNVNFEKDQIIISDDAIKYIVENFTDGEKGVRNLRRCLEVIYTKLNLYRLMEKGSTLFDSEETIEITYPFNVSVDIVDKLLKKNSEDQLWRHMYT